MALLAHLLRLAEGSISGLVVGQLFEDGGGEHIMGPFGEAADDLEGSRGLL